MSKECLNETNMAFQVYPVYPCFCVLLSFYLEPLLPRPPLPLILCTLVFLLMLTLTLLRKKLAKEQANQLFAAIGVGIVLIISLLIWANWGEGSVTWKSLLAGSDVEF